MDCRVKPGNDGLMLTHQCYGLMCLRFAKPTEQSSFARKLHYPALGIV
jgi:hypothetical protein